MNTACIALGVLCVGINALATVANLLSGHPARLLVTVPGIAVGIVLLLAVRFYRGQR